MLVFDQASGRGVDAGAEESVAHGRVEVLFRADVELVFVWLELDRAVMNANASVDFVAWLDDVSALVGTYTRCHKRSIRIHRLGLVHR